MPKKLSSHRELRPKPALSEAEHVALSKELAKILESFDFLIALHNRFDSGPYSWPHRDYHVIASGITGLFMNALNEAVESYGIEFAAHCYVKNGKLLIEYGGGNPTAEDITIKSKDPLCAVQHTLQRIESFLSKIPTCNVCGNLLAGKEHVADNVCLKCECEHA